MSSEGHIDQSRRQFMKLFGAGSLACLGCGHICAMGALGQKPMEKSKHKFMDDSKMTFAQLFDFGYMATAQTLKLMADKMGKENFMKALKEASAESAAAGMKQFAKSVPKNNLQAFAQVMKKPDYFWKHVLTLDIVEDKENVFEIKVKECLWAKTFRLAKAGDIGYSMICHADFAMAQAFNPKMKMIRSKTLMQGHDSCNHRWVMET